MDSGYARRAPTRTTDESVARQSGGLAPAARGADLDLVRRALRGEPRAVDRFVERMRCVPRFLSVLNGKLGLYLDDHDCADLTQQALVVIWKKLELFEGRATLETWAYRIVRFEVLNELRRKRRSPAALGDEPVPSAEPSEADYESLDYDLLTEALEGLGEDETRVIRLKHYEHLKFTEIGKRLGIPPETAKTRYYRGLRHLARRLGPRMAEDEPS